MDQRTQVVIEYFRNTNTVEEIAAGFGISRKTAYKWVDRFEACGAAGLVDRPRRPHYCPLATSEDLVTRILGTENLRAILTRENLSLPWPRGNHLLGHSQPQRPRHKGPAPPPRTPNGGPFSSPVALSRIMGLSTWWVRLGIYPELVEPGCLKL